MLSFRRQRASILLALLGAAPAPLYGQGSEGAGEDELEVTEIVLSRSLDDGQPVEPGTRFRRSDGRIYATIHLSNPKSEAASIRVNWEPADADPRPGGIVLDIPARTRYRTVARTGTRRAAGEYRCVVYNANDRVLASVAFTLVDTRTSSRTSGY